MEKVSKEEALKEIARLEKKLERRKRKEEKRAKIREKVKASNNALEKEKSPLHQRQSNVNFESSPKVILLESNLQGDNESSRTSSPVFPLKRKGGRRKPKKSGNVLESLKILDVNELAAVDEENFDFETCKFRLPQPNSDLSRVREFSLPREYTGLKLETKRQREVLMEPEEWASQSILKRKRRKLEPLIEKEEEVTVILGK